MLRRLLKKKRFRTFEQKLYLKECRDIDTSSSAKTAENKFREKRLQGKTCVLFAKKEEKSRKKKRKKFVTISKILYRSAGYIILA